MQSEIRRNVRHNFTFNVLDGAFFGFALGIASFDSVIPFFINTLTDSTILIGLSSSIHTIGWQLPQLFTAHHVSRLRRYKPMTMLMTIQERWPFLGLALVALLIPVIGTELALIAALLLVTWQGLGGGFAATAWQSLIGKIMPSNRVGTFFGVQSAAANLFAAGGAVMAGRLLAAVGSNYGFAMCFLLAGIAMTISFGFVTMTREPENEPVEVEVEPLHFRQNLRVILEKDHNFRWFLAARLLFQLALMASYFLTIYGIRQFNMDEQTGGLMIGIFALSQTVANPILGWIGDQWSHRRVFALGALLASASAGIAIIAPSLGWLYVIFILAGFSRVCMWAIAMSLTLEFGKENERPLYIGLSNTLLAPFSLVLPLLGGWLVDNFGFEIMFLVALIGGLLAAYVTQFMMRDPRPKKHDPILQPTVVTA